MSTQNQSAHAPHTATGPLDVLSRRRDTDGKPWIGPSARMAAERFAVDLMRAGMVPRVTMDWSRGGKVDRGLANSGLNASVSIWRSRPSARISPAC
jgi:hypothetical protein